MEWIFLTLAIILFFVVYTLWENSNPMLEKYTIKSNLPINIENLSVLHISDLHNYRFGENQKKLIDLIKKKYDLILITGDFIDRRYPNVDVAMEFIENIPEKYKTKILFTTGNHEKGTCKYKDLRKRLLENEVKILDNEVYDYNNINIVGLADPTEYITINKKKKKDYFNEIEYNLEKLCDNNKYNLVLSHRPEYFDLYVNHNVDVVFTGHSHGGQVRIFNRGLYAPDQGFFAKYVGVIFNKKDTIMVNSRGLGNNFPFAKRVFNRPHLLEINIIR